MIRHLVLSVTAVLVLGAFLVAGCANPLESTPDPSPSPGLDTLRLTDTLLLMDTLFVSDTLPCTDTVFVPDSIVYQDTLIVTDTVFQQDTVTVVDTLRSIDTLVVSDTVSVVDTVTIRDTMVVTDTLVQIDTVVVTIPDSTECGRMCAQLGSSTSDFTWLLDNEAGMHRLEFASLADRNQPPQTLIVDVSGELYEWTVQDVSEFSIELNLPADATIRMEVDQPKALGHSIAVCLTATPL